MPARATHRLAETISGLPIKSLQALYTLRKIDLAEGTTLIDILASHDPISDAAEPFIH